MRSGITSAFNKTLNEALQIGIKIRWFLTNKVTPSLLMGVLKGEFGTPGLVGAVSIEKVRSGKIRLLTAPRTIPESGLLHDLNEDVNNATTMRTVSAGKVYYLIQVGINLVSTANDEDCEIYTSKGAEPNNQIVRLTSEIDATRTVDSQTLVIAYPHPIPIAEGRLIQLKGGSVNTLADGWLIGWEENA